jgi:hypothetical protein
MFIVLGVPTHVPNVGVTVITEVIEAAVLLVAVNDGIVPTPVAGIPIPGCVLVHPKTAFAGAPVIVCVGIVAPAQTLYVPPGLTTAEGVGLTSTVTVCWV